MKMYIKIIFLDIFQTFWCNVMNLNDGEIILTVHFTFIKVILQQSSKIFRPCGENWFVTKIFVSINNEDDIYKGLLHPGHQRQLNTIPRPELQRKSLLSQDSQVLLEFTLTEITVKMQGGNGGSSLALNCSGKL